MTVTQLLAVVMLTKMIRCAKKHENIHLRHVIVIAIILTTVVVRLDKIVVMSHPTFILQDVMVVVDVTILVVLVALEETLETIMGVGVSNVLVGHLFN
jgi:hypothetical protein